MSVYQSNLVDLEVEMETLSEEEMMGFSGGAGGIAVDGSSTTDVDINIILLTANIRVFLDRLDVHVN